MAESENSEPRQIPFPEPRNRKMSLFDFVQEWFNPADASEAVVKFFIFPGVPGIALALIGIALSHT